MPPKDRHPKPEEVGTTELCKLVGINGRTLRRWLASDSPPPHRQLKTGRKERRWIVSEFTAWMQRKGVDARKQTRKAIKAAEASPAASEDDALETDPTAVDALTLARLIKQTDLILKREKVRKERRANEEAEGRLIEAEKVVAEHSRAVRVARDRLAAIAPSLAGRLANISDPVEIEALLSGAVEDALRNLSEASR